MSETKAPDPTGRSPLDGKEGAGGRTDGLGNDEGDGGAVLLLFATMWGRAERVAAGRSGER